MFSVETGGCLVQDEHGSISQKSTRQGQALHLPGTQGRPTFGEQCIVAVRQRLDKLVGVC